MESSKGMRKEVFEGDSKLVDLMSRVNGGELVIPGLGDEGRERNRKVDKVCISVSLLLRRFEGLEIVPWTLLHFISRMKFWYGVRSLCNLIDLIPLKEAETQELKIRDLKLPFDETEILKESNLIRHIICEDGPAHVVNLWKKLKKFRNPVRIAEEKQPPSSIDVFLRVLWGKERVELIKGF